VKDIYTNVACWLHPSVCILPSFLYSLQLERFFFPSLRRRTNAEWLPNKQALATRTSSNSNHIPVRSCAAREPDRGSDRGRLRVDRAAHGNACA
jgi:hypothetical protein